MQCRIDRSSHCVKRLTNIKVLSKSSFQNIFDTESLDSIMLATRDPLEWHFKPLDHSVGLSFRNNFHFALVGHLIKENNTNFALL